MSNKPCRHYAKYKAVHPPRCSCSACWRKYWLMHPGRYAAVQYGLEQGRRNDLVSMLGEKYIKKFEQFRRGREIAEPIAA